MALSFLADENFDGRVFRALTRRSVDIVRVQDVGLSAADDPAVLAWAASAGRILLTHDRKTMPDLARDGVAAGEPIPGVVDAPQTGWRVSFAAFRDFVSG